MSIGAIEKFPEMPTVNFNKLYGDGFSQVKIEKMKCLFKALEHATTDTLHSIVKIWRSSPSMRHFFNNSEAFSVSINPYNKDTAGNNIGMDSYMFRNNAQNPRKYFVVDFANCMIGGGVLGHGAVQEEILFVEHPDCIAARCVMPKMEANESIIIEGARKTCSHLGYANQFEFDRISTTDLSPPTNSILGRVFVCINATDYSKRKQDQYHIDEIRRELIKALSGFSAFGIPQNCVTGNWGCGAFGGDETLKALIQILAASMAYLESINYCCFGKVKLHADLKLLIGELKNHRTTVGEYFRAMVKTAEAVKIGRAFKMTDFLHSKLPRRINFELFPQIYV
ncbi:hypothetical protein Ciccas_011825 [Cichlidogyrus casuarinus]|uniref:PARG catalytic Macro domain-containing protein n=1 Tax=Cichlidogyrus casuarinus TaxID=1844966 RepID=A0ABD2PT53_9PLAT